MIIKRIKYFNEENLTVTHTSKVEEPSRFKDILHGAGYGAAAGLLSSGVLADGFENKYILPIVGTGTLIGAGVGAYLGNRSYNIRKQRIKDWNKEAEREEHNKERWNNLSSDHRELLNIYKLSKKYEPQWGDGDEYPHLILNDFIDYEDMPFGCISFGEDDYQYVWKNGKWYYNGWKDNRQISSLKQGLLSDIELYERDWNTDENIEGLSETEIKIVLNYLSELKNIIKKSKLK